MRARNFALSVCGICLVLCSFAGFAGAAPVEFVQICGTGSFFFIPDTSNCVDANQILANDLGVTRQASAAFTGIAMSSSLVDPFMPDHANFAISVHETVFEHKPALGIAALVRLHGNLMFSAGLALAEDMGSFTTTSVRTPTANVGVEIPVVNWSQFDVLGRIGLVYSW